LERKLISIFAGYYAVYAILHFDNLQHAMNDLDWILLLIAEWFTEFKEEEDFLNQAQQKSYNYVIEKSPEIKNLAKRIEWDLELNREQIREIYYGV